MHRIVIALTIFAASISAGCARAKQSKESSFLHNFSIVELVGQNTSHVGLDCSEGGTGNDFSIQDSASRDFQSDKNEDCNCQVRADAVESFSEATLMSALAGDLEKAIVASGARIINRGPGNSSFYFEYVLDDRKGRVEIVVQRQPTANYRLEAHLKERNAE